MYVVIINFVYNGDIKITKLAPSATEQHETYLHSFGLAGTSPIKAKDTEFVACTHTTLIFWCTLEMFSRFVILHYNVVQLHEAQN